MIASRWLAACAASFRCRRVERGVPQFRGWWMVGWRRTPRAGDLPFAGRAPRTWLRIFIQLDTVQLEHVFSLEGWRKNILPSGCTLLAAQTCQVAFSTAAYNFIASPGIPKSSQFIPFLPLTMAHNYPNHPKIIRIVQYHQFILFLWLTMAYNYLNHPKIIPNVQYIQFIPCLWLTMAYNYPKDLKIITIFNISSLYYTSFVAYNGQQLPKSSQKLFHMSNITSYTIFVAYNGLQVSQGS